MVEARDYASGVLAGLKAKIAALSGSQKVLAAGLATAAAGGTIAAYEIGKFADSSIRAASQFQQSQTLLTTQAGVAQSRIQGLGDAFLSLAPKLGQTAQNLSGAFYHIASAGVPVRDQLATLKAAAMGAAIGNANLEDTTNSLVAALRSGVGGISGARNAMATLMAIVGAGNMRLEDLNAAMGTGLPGTSKTFGLSLQSVGAALSYLTDTGMPASQAATRLRMSIALLGGPTSQSAKVLHALGLTSDEIKSKFAVVSQELQKAHVTSTQLAADMRKPDGLLVALTDLKDRMTQAGLSASTQADVIARAFGGGHQGAAIMQMFENLEKVKQKYEQIGGSVDGFGRHWQQTTQTAAFQSKQLHAAISSISVAIGEALLPAVQKLAGWIVPIVTRIAEWTAHHKKLAAIILGSLFAFSALVAVLGAIALAAFVVDAAFSPIILIVVGIAAAIAGLVVAFIEIEKHWSSWGKWVAIALAAVMPILGLPLLIYRYWSEIPKWAREIWEDVRTFLVTETNRIIALVLMYWRDFKGWLGTIWADIETTAISYWQDLLAFLHGIWSSIVETAQDVWNGIKDFLVDVWNAIKDAWNDTWGWIADVGKDIWGRLVSAWKATWDGIKDVLQTIWDGIKTAFNATWNALKVAADTIWSGLQTAWAAFWDAMKTVLVTIWDGIAAAGKAIWSGMSDAASAIWSGLQTAWAAFWNAMKAVMTPIWNGIKDVAGAVWSGMKTVAGAVWDGLQSAWAATWNALKAAMTAIWNALKAAAEAIWHALSVAAGAVWDGLKEAWTATWNGIKAALGASWNGIRSLARSFWSELKAIFNDAESFFSSVGEAIMRGLLNGINSLKDSVISALQWVADKAKDVATLGGLIGSPSPYFTRVGEAIMQGLQVGITNASQLPIGALTTATGDLRSAPLGLGTPSGGGGDVINLTVDARGSFFPDQKSIDVLTSLIGSQLATKILPGSGMSVRRR
jgi:TP901 family phage tail tape measure protein